MIAQLTGEVVAARPTALVLDVGGVGFLVACPPATSAEAQIGQVLTLHTHLAVREDALTLYGFVAPEERDAFVLVQSVSGIGPKLALAVVAQLTPAQLRQAILAENLMALSSVPGIGKKTAQRLILELKEKAPGLDATAAPEAEAGSDWKQQVVLGLTGLGYSAKDAEGAWESVSDQAHDPAASVSGLMRAALQSLARL